MDTPSDARMLAEVEAFLAAHAIAPTTFGREALNDPNLVRQLRNQERSLSLRNAERVVLWMKAYATGTAKTSTVSRNRIANGTTPHNTEYSA